MSKSTLGTWRRLIYIANTSSSFYGFPANYYNETYPNQGSKEVAEKVISLLSKAAIKTNGTRRGLDHGVWAVFKVGR
jgi:aromatic ring-opening dioxygenase catalytic subunit (LigB family)